MSKQIEQALSSAEIQAAIGFVVLGSLVKLYRSPEAQEKFGNMLKKFKPLFGTRGISPKQIADLGVMGGCGYLGYKAFKSPFGILVGALGYKLATSSMTGDSHFSYEGTFLGSGVKFSFPFNSQVIGLFILGSVGIGYMSSWISENFMNWMPKLIRSEERPIPPPTTNYSWKECAENCARDLGYAEEEIPKIRGYLYGYRGRNLYQIADMMINAGYGDIVSCADECSGFSTQSQLQGDYS